MDTLRSNEGPLSVSSKINNRHPLESRIKNWDQTQRDHQLETYRRMFGAAEPIKREMELNIVQENDFKPMLLGGPSNTQRDILLNKDTRLDWEDIYTGKSIFNFDLSFTLIAQFVVLPNIQTY